MPIWLFFTTNPLGKKIALFSICAIIIGLGVRWYGNREYYSGHARGVEDGAETVRKSQEEAWKIKEEAIEAARREAQAERDQIAAEALEVKKLRDGLNVTLAQIRANSKAKREASDATVSSIPSDLLDGALRRKSAELGPTSR